MTVFCTCWFLHHKCYCFTAASIYDTPPPPSPLLYRPRYAESLKSIRPSSSSSSSSSRSSDGNSSLLNEGGSASQVPQASVELAVYWSVVWPYSLSERLVDGAGLQLTFCCLTASTAKARTALYGQCGLWNKIRLSDLKKKSENLSLF